MLVKRAIGTEGKGFADVNILKMGYVTYITLQAQLVLTQCHSRLGKAISNVLYFLNERDSLFWALL